MERNQESLDHIMKEFRSNGKDVDYVELDLDAMELDRYAPDARSLIVGLLQDSGLDAEMKIIRPPSKTPHHLPTSTINLMKQQLTTSQVPPSYPPWNSHFVQQVPYHGRSQSAASYVVDLTQSMSQLALTDQGVANFFISTATTQQVSRPIFGTGSTMKPSVAGLRQTRIWKWDCHAFNIADPGCSPLHVSINPGAPDKLLETPVSNSPGKTNERGLFSNKLLRSCLENEGSSEEDLSIGAESMDSGNFTGGDMSPGSDLSPTSSSGVETDALSYASVLNTPTMIHSEAACELTQTSTEVSPETPKSRKLEGIRTHTWTQKKFRRLSDAALYDDGYRYKECVFCKTNGETPSLYRGHVLKDEKGRTVCHVLQKYVCPLCGATGENAHTLKYCPHNSNPPAVSMMTTLKSMRSATGNIRMMSNSRRTRATARRHQKRSNPSGVSPFGIA